MRSILASLTILTYLLLSVSPAYAGETRSGGKLLLTNGITSLEGASGGGLTPWAVIAGNETRDGVGLSLHLTTVQLKSFDFRSAGVSVGLFDRVELSVAHQQFNTKQVGAQLGLGRNFIFDQDVVGAKVRVAGDLVYGASWMPAIALGATFKKNHEGNVVRAFGARHDQGVDLTLSATKLLLSRSLLVNLTVRMTKANQIGLLGFGGDKGDHYSPQVEGSVGLQLSRRLVIGGEIRTKPDQLSVAREDKWRDLFAAFAIDRHLTLIAAFTDLGSIATVKAQRGALFSLQTAL